MIETFFLDWGLCVGVGLLFGRAGRREAAAAGSALRTRAFRIGFLYTQAGVIAVSLALFAMNPDWMWMYWLRPADLPVAVVVLSFALYEACYIAGFAIASELERFRRDASRAPIAALGVLLTAAEVATRVRLFHFGSVDEFRAGLAPLGIRTSPLRIEPEVWLLLGAGGVSLALLALLVRSASRDRSEPV